MAERTVPLADGPLLLALDHPRDAHAILPIARRLGERMNRGLVIVHASVSPGAPADVLARLQLSREDVQGVAIEPLSGPPALVLPRYARARHCALLLIGLAAHGHEPSTLARTLLTESPCPVLLLPSEVSESWGQGGTVLLPLDGSPSTAAVAPLAISMAQRLEAALDILYVAGAYPANEPGTLTVPTYIDQAQYEWQMWRREFMSRFYERHLTGASPRAVHLSVSTGDRPRAILDQARRQQPDLIVIGWHGNLRQARAQTLRAVLRESSWPVLVARI